MTKLTDTQAILLSTAAARDGGSLYPLPDTLTAPKPAITKSIEALLRRSLAEQRETSDPASVHRTDGDPRYGLFVTAAGLAAIGVGDAGLAGAVLVPNPAPSVAKRPRASKTGAVIALLSRDHGATMPELIEATGWLPHTTRAALTGLRKKGHGIERSKRGDDTCYRIVTAA